MIWTCILVLIVLTIVGAVMGWVSFPQVYMQPLPWMVMGVAVVLVFLLVLWFLREW